MTDIRLNINRPTQLVCEVSLTLGCLSELPAENTNTTVPFRYSIIEGSGITVIDVKLYAFADYYELHIYLNDVHDGYCHIIWSESDTITVSEFSKTGWTIVVGNGSWAEIWLDLTTISLSSSSTTEFSGNVVILYRQNDVDSLEFANYYKDKHNLSEGSLIPLPCSLDEILASYQDFYDQIESPLINQLGELLLGSEYTKSIVKYIIVGFHVPGGFIDNGDVIATTSRLARINFPYVKKTDNPIYAPALYDTSQIDLDEVIICSRIDAPTLANAKFIVDNAITISKQGYANGQFYFDKIAASNEYNDAYALVLEDFENTVLPQLNMTVFRTYAWDENTDVPLFRLKNDSIVWAFEADRAGYTYFEPTKYSRCFCYNADTDGAYTVRDVNAARWPMLALLSGYASTAGAMSDPTVDGYLSPSPFFDALLQGYTVGEAFVRSVPFLNWTVGLFGDPLLTFRFPQGPSKTYTISEINTIEQTAENIADSIAFNIARQNALTSITNIILGYTDNIAVKDKLFNAAVTMKGRAELINDSYYTKLINSFFQFAPNINSLLLKHNTKISSLLNETLGNNVVDSNNLYVNGQWHIDHVLTRSSGFFRYHFVIEASVYSDFLNPFATIDSEISLNGWFYEKNQDEFVAIPANGVAANFAGRRIRYIGSFPITRGTMFYVRIRQRDNLSQLTEWVNINKVGNT